MPRSPSAITPFRALQVCLFRLASPSVILDELPGISPSAVPRESLDAVGYDDDRCAEDGREDNGKDSCNDEAAERGMIGRSEVFEDEGGTSAGRNGEDDGGEVPCDKHDEFDPVDGDEDGEGSEHDSIHHNGCERFLVEIERVMVARLLIFGLVFCEFCF